MTAKEFIESKGSITDPNIRFVNSGNTVIVPLEDLLNEFSGVNIQKVQKPAPKKPVVPVRMTQRKG